MTEQGTFWGSTPTNVNDGQTFSIDINSPANAGETITVTVWKADGTAGTPPTVQITLDVDGKGSASYTAPSNTSFLKLTCEGENDHRVNIN